MANPNGRGLIILCPARPNMKHNTSAEKDLAWAFFKAHCTYVTLKRAHRGTKEDEIRKQELKLIK